MTSVDGRRCTVGGGRWTVGADGGRLVGARPTSIDLDLGLEHAQRLMTGCRHEKTRAAELRNG